MLGVGREVRRADRREADRKEVGVCGEGIQAEGHGEHCGDQGAVDVSREETVVASTAVGDSLRGTV